MMTPEQRHEYVMGLMRPTSRPQQQQQSPMANPQLLAKMLGGGATTGSGAAPAPAGTYGTFTGNAVGTVGAGTGAGAGAGAGSSAGFSPAMATATPAAAGTFSVGGAGAAGAGGGAAAGAGAAGGGAGAGGAGGAALMNPYLAIPAAVVAGKTYESYHPDSPISRASLSLAGPSAGQMMKDPKLAATTALGVPFLNGFIRSDKAAGADTELQWLGSLFS